MSLLKEVIQRNEFESIRVNTEISGLVRGLEGTIVETDGFPASVGSICEIDSLDDYRTSAEVIGFRNNRNLVALHNTDTKLKVGARVRLIDEGVNIRVGEKLLGRVIDGMGYPLDGKKLDKLDDSWPLNGKAVNPLDRKKIDTIFDVGVRTINSIVTIGKGQRIGIIAGSGVGKSVLLQMMSKYSNSDVVVVGLIGERAREVKVMVESLLSFDKNNKIIIVAVPADRSPLLRMRGANRCTAIAEYFRSRGKNVLLIMDSLTRVAHAKREIGLALGEQPTSKGYITGFYTVLADSDDHNDPVVDSARAILDGHIILSREQAQLGIYPAIDIQNSISRVMDDIVSDEQKKLSRELKKMVSVYKESRDLVLMGGYSKGQDKSIDLAHKLWPKIVEFMKQDSSEKDNIEGSFEKLKKLLEYLNKND